MNASLLPLTPDEFRRATIFKGVNVLDVEHVLVHCPLVRADTDTVILRAGQRVERLYVLVNGSVTVRLDSPLDQPVARFSEGEIFGEFSVIDGRPASAFVVAESPCRLLGIDREALSLLIGASPEIADNMLGILITRVRQSNRFIRMLQARLEGRPFSETASGDDDVIEDPTGTFAGDTI
ncbi:MAG: Crp/Fnr family transcriptional regulator [Gammaproteobacteria bacterium]